ncbi:unnamed protein product [Cylindrotheca closterium]|uniref:Uncharacterized protein n=1 Tax=Cylindrotheca closterium TaxID=2856 RepID=A0AAD2FXL5_9STRA|nr:unnamed protein product [Cylindrotheca closterium]
MPNRPQQMQDQSMTRQETREDETLLMEEEQEYQENIHKISSMEAMNDGIDNDNDDNEDPSSIFVPPIHHVSEESRQQHESPVLLSARFDSMLEDYENNEESCREQSSRSIALMYSTLRSPEEERRSSPVSTNFLRSEAELPSNLPPSFPPFLSDAAASNAALSPSLVPSPLNGTGSARRDKPTLLRSLAWSQDSQEERRITKRRKEEPMVMFTTDTSTNDDDDNDDGPSTPEPQQHHRRTNSSSPTMVHWEDEVMELSDFVHKAIQHQQGTPTHG